MRFSPLVFWKNNKICFFMGVSLFLAGLSAWAEESSSVWKEDLGLSGSLRVAGWAKDKSFSSNTGYLVGGAWLQARPKEVWGLRSFFDGRIQGQDFSRSSHSQMDLREGFVETSFGSMDIKIGRQITVWGRADKLNPTDSFSVKNLKLLTTDDEDQRTGLFASQLIWNWENYRLIGLWQPEWRAPKLPLSPLPNGVGLRYGDPDKKMEQFGLKVDHSGEYLDWSLSYAQALDRNPDLKILFSNGNITNLELSFQRIHVWGFDFAKTIGDYGFRGESTFTKTQDTSGNDSLTKNSNISAVFGVERTFWGDLNINLQALYRHTLHWQEPDQIGDVNQRFLAKQLNLLSNQKRPHTLGGSLRISHKMFHETLETELAVVGWTENGLFRPKITYAFSDSLRGILGGEIYVGKRDSFFGRLKDTSSAFAEARFLF